MYRFALVWWVLERTSSGVALSKLVITQAVPTLLFLLVGGVVVDRFSRIRIMLASDVLRGVLTLAFAWLAFSGALELWHVYVASFAFGVVNAFFVPAFTATVPMVTTAEDRPSANALTAISTSLSAVVGPSLSAVLLALVGIDLILLINALTFLVSAACLLPLVSVPVKSLAPAPAATVPFDDVDDDFTGYLKRAEEGRPVPGGFGSTVTMVGVLGQGWEGLDDIEPEQQQKKKTGGILDDLRTGFRVVFAEPRLWIAVLVSLIFYSAAASTMLITLPYILIHTMQFDAGAVGILNSFGAISMVASSIWLGRQTKLRHRGLLSYAGAMVMGITLLVIGVFPLIAVICGVVVIHFVAWAAICLIWRATVQECVEHDKLGRVSAIDSLSYGVAIPIFVAANGWAIDHVGPEVVFIASGGLGILCGGLALLHPRIRSYD